MGMTSVDLGLRVIPNKNLPDTWSYQKSVERVRGLILSFKVVSKEMLHELWVAREMLDARGGDRKSEDWKSNVPIGTFGQYLEDVGLARTTAHRWLSQYIPEERRKKTPEEIADQRRRIDEANKRIGEAQESPEPERKERVNIDETFSKLDGIMGELADREAEKTRFREKIKMTGDNQRDPFFDVLEEYLSSLSDNQKMEACHNIIKYCKRVVNSLHVVAAKGESA